MLAACDVLHQAHHHAVRFLRFNDHCRDLFLTEQSKGFQTSFAANQVVAVGIVGVSAHSHRSLEPDGINVIDDFFVQPFVSGTGVQDLDAVNPYHLKVLGAGWISHATSRRDVRLVSA